MPCYFNAAEKAVYRLDDVPGVTQGKTRGGKPDGHRTVSGTLETTFAENPTDPETGRLTRPEIKAAISHFEPHYHSDEEVVKEWFLKWQPEGSEEISPEVYQQRKAEYLASRKRPSQPS